MAPGIGSTRREEDADHGAAAAAKLHGQGVLTGLAAVAFAVVPMAVSEPPPWVDEKTYFLALWGVFIAGMAQTIAAVWLSNNEPRRRCPAVATGTKLMYCVSVAAIVVTGSLSAASLTC